MPAGDLLEAQGDLEWDGLRIAPLPDLTDDGGDLLPVPDGFFYDVDTAVSGLGVPPLRAVEQDRDGDGTTGAKNGGRPGRQVVIDRLYVSGREALFELRKRMATVPDDEALFFRGMGPAVEGDEDFCVFPARVSLSYVEDEQAQVHGIAVVTAEWYCDDPLIYSLTETGTEVDGTNPTVPNGGIAAAPWRLVVQAGGSPVVGFRVRRMDDSTRFLIDYADVTIPAGGSLTVDTRPGKEYARLSTGAFVTGKGRNGSRLAEWWRIPVGGEHVGAASDSGSFTATMYVRDAYL